MSPSKFCWRVDPFTPGSGGRSEVALQVRIDIDAFLQRDAELEAQARALAALLSQQPVLDISYEALSADTAATVKRVAAFLGLGTARLTSSPR